MKKVLIVPGSVLLLLIILGVTFFQTITSKSDTYAEIIKDNWSIELPIPHKEVFSVDSGPSWLGDGERYHIFEYVDNDSINLSLKWDNVKDIEMESEVRRILGLLNVSESNYPDFKKNYKCYTKHDDNSTIYLIYVDDLRKLYIIEDIS